MTVNPDNFIFHSDFWYPQTPLTGTKSLTSQPLPSTQTLTSGVEEGDLFFVYFDDTLGGSRRIYAGAGAWTTYADVVGGNLRMTLGAQAPGAAYTGTLRWYVYKKRDKFNFNSTRGSDKVVWSMNGAVQANVNGEYIGNIPTGMTVPLRTFGIWRRVGDTVWRPFNETSSGGRAFATWVNSSPNRIDLYFSSSANSTIEYRLIGMKI